MLFPHHWVGAVNAASLRVVRYRCVSLVAPVSALVIRVDPIVFVEMIAIIIKCIPAGVFLYEFITFYVDACLYIIFYVSLGCSV